MENIDLHVEPTPNPNALKFIADRPFKLDGSSTYRTPMECENNPLAKSLFMIRGVDQLHLFDNVVTVTKFNFEDWGGLEEEILETLRKELPKHNPEYYDPDPKAERRRALPPELQKIEEIFDRTIRPGLQADGGDIETISLEDSILLVRYQGACGTCPSSTTGTLEAIKGILREEFDQGIQVYIAPDY